MVEEYNHFFGVPVFFEKRQVSKIGATKRAKINRAQKRKNATKQGLFIWRFPYLVYVNLN